MNIRANAAARSGPAQKAAAPVKTIAKTDHSPQVTVFVQPTVLSEKKSLADPTLYAPAIPGVLVALAGIWFAHALTMRRDRRKDIAIACEQLRALADSAVESATAAWTTPAGKKRDGAVRDTRRRFQNVGIAATDLEGLTRKPRILETLLHPRSTIKRYKGDEGFWAVRSVDLTKEVVALKKTAMADPFDEPLRNASSAQIAAINTELETLWLATGNQLRAYYGDLKR